MAEATAACIAPAPHRRARTRRWPTIPAALPLLVLSLGSAGAVDLTVAALRLKKLPWTVLPKRREFQFHYEMNAIADSDGSASTIVCFDATIVVSTSPIAVSLLGPLV